MQYTQNDYLERMYVFLHRCMYVYMMTCVNMCFRKPEFTTFFAEVCLFLL